MHITIITDTIPTSLGEVIPEKLVSTLQFQSYCANRGYGLTKEDLKSIGFTNVEVYEQLYQKLSAPSDD